MCASDTSITVLLNQNLSWENLILHLIIDMHELLSLFLMLFVFSRLVLVPAHKLKLSEEIRAELQIWTPSLQEYLSVFMFIICDWYRYQIYFHRKWFLTAWSCSYSRFILTKGGGGRVIIKLVQPILFSVKLVAI